jgi:hypothetical protein
MMRKVVGLIVLNICIIAFLTGCYMKEAAILRDGTPLQPINLSAGSRILLSETSPGFATYEIKRFGREVKPSNMTIVHPPDGKYTGTMLPKVVKKMAAEMNVDLIFVAVITKRSKVYNDKKGTRIVVLNIYACDVYQYDGNGELVGRRAWLPSVPWPENFSYTGADIAPSVTLYDARDDFQKWLNSNLPSN